MRAAGGMGKLRRSWESRPMYLMLATLLGCPSEAPEETTPVAMAPGAPSGDPNAGPPPGGEMGAVPGGGAGGAGGAGGQAPPPGGAPALIEVAPGTGVKLTGSISYAGKVDGTIRMDVLKKSDTMPELVFSTKLDKVGPFETEIPKDLGTAQVTVFIDSAGDGPSPGEPMAASAWIEVAQAPITDMNLSLAALDPNVAPGGAGGPPANAAGAPPAGAPPAGAPGAPPAGGAPPAAPK